MPVESRIAGLDSGADDYLVKPFDFGELLARLRAVIRRGRLPVTPAVLSVGDLRLDVRSREAFRRGRRIRLTSREFALLEFMALHAGEVVGRGAIAEHVWDAQFDSMSNVIDVLIQRIRRKIDDPKGRSLITTRRGEGYMLSAVMSGVSQFMTLPIRTRLTLWYSSIVVVVLVTGAVVGSFAQSRLAMQRLDDDLARTLATLDGLMRAEFVEGHTVEAAAAEASSELVVPDRTLELTGPDGSVLPGLGSAVRSRIPAARDRGPWRCNCCDASRRASDTEPGSRALRLPIYCCGHGSARRAARPAQRDGSGDVARCDHGAHRGGRRRLVDRTTDAEALDTDGRAGGRHQRAEPHGPAGCATGKRRAGPARGSVQRTAGPARVAR